MTVYGLIAVSIPASLKIRLDRADDYDCYVNEDGNIVVDAETLSAYELGALREIRQQNNMATIEGEDGDTITLWYAEGVLHADETVIGPEFASEEQAAQYIHDSYGRGWNLTWLNQ